MNRRQRQSWPQYQYSGYHACVVVAFAKSESRNYKSKSMEVSLSLISQLESLLRKFMYNGNV